MEHNRKVGKEITERIGKVGRYITYLELILFCKARDPEKSKHAYQKVMRPPLSPGF